MTGYEIPEFWARVTVLCSLVGMFVGVLLIVLALFTTKRKYNEHLAVTNEMLRVYEGQLHELDRVATMEIRQERSAKKQIPDKLRDIDDYLAEIVKSQDLDAVTLVSMAKKIFRWYDWFKILFMMITYTTNIFRRIFKNTHIKYVIQFTTRFNLALREYGLGTLPTIESDQQYLRMYGELIQLESGLPHYITAKIHRNILLVISVNSLRILRSDSSFWDDMEAKKAKQIMENMLLLIRNSLGMLMITLDNTIVGLRGEVSSDIEKYVEG